MKRHNIMALFLLVLFLTLTNSAVSKQHKQLMLIDSATTDKKSAMMPIVQSIKEWNVSVDLSLLNAKTSRFDLSLPHEKHPNLWAQQTFFKTYQSGNSQWEGDLFSGTDKQAIGDILINIINDRPFAIINVKNTSYEIYTDAAVGTRLAEINNQMSADDAAVIYSDSDHEESLERYNNAQVRNDHNTLFSDTDADSVSVIDVLVVADDEYNHPNSPIWDRIELEFMNAEAILRNSGENGGKQGGVPVILNYAGLEFMDIPDEYEEVSDATIKHLSQGLSAESAELRHRLNRSGADYVAVFLPYAPPALEPCGKGTIAGNASIDATFATSVTINTTLCNASQYLLLHELMHNFGSKHLPADPTSYETHASGFDIKQSGQSIFSTLMGCTKISGQPSISTSCGRKRHLSSPKVNIEGETIGDAKNADNSWFLTKCAGTDCRRGQLANRNNRMFVNDLKPGISLTVDLPDPNNPAPVTSHFELTAKAYDDNEVVSVHWEIYKSVIQSSVPVDILVNSGFGQGQDFSFVTDAFATQASYRVDVTVEDNAKQKTFLTFRQIRFVDVPPVITFHNTGCGNNYCIRLEGDDFGDDPQVVVKSAANNQVLATYSGHLIFNRGQAANGNDFVFFPIVEVNQQSLFRAEGLCFIVMNGSLSSNEVCFTRPVTNPQGLFMGSVVESYTANQDIDYDAYIVKNNQTVLKIWGNSWKKIARPYNVTPRTVLEFDFKSTHQEGEIAAVGFLVNGANNGINDLGNRTWQVHGTEIYGHQDFNNYSGHNIKRYRLPIGEKFTGQISHIVFISDDDNQRAGQSNLFISPILKESDIDLYDDVPAVRAYDDDVKEQSVSWLSGDTVHQHTFHDVGDVDWTSVYLGGSVRFRTELVGSQADTKMTVYRWINHTQNSDGTFSNIQQQLVGLDHSAGASEVIAHIPQAGVYAIKIESGNNAVGADTRYNLILDRPPASAPDEYDNVPSQRAYNDDLEGQAVSWGNGDTEHFHNFHDDGDVDWTIVYASGDIKFSTQLLGADADTRMTVYKWTAADLHPSNDGRYINIVHSFVGQDHSAGASEVITSAAQAAIFAIRVESRGNVYGPTTSYKLVLSRP